MNAKPFVAAIGLATAAVAVGQIVGGPGTGRTAPSTSETAIAVQPQGGNPDVLVWDIYGYVNFSQGDFRAYSIGTESCNVGDAPLAWFANNNQHPVIGQNMYRLADGPNGHPRFEQIGQSWLKHGFCALDLSDCGTCQGTGCNTLGVGCSDPYSASLNANQSSAGPKWQVNPTTGFFPYPPANPSYSGAVARRLRVANSDVSSSQHPNASFYMEAQYVCPDENPTVDVLNARNNVSWRRAQLNFAGQMSGYVGVTQVGDAAIHAWKAADPHVRLTVVTLPLEGTIHVASRAYDNGDGTWDYEYAVHNQDVHRSVGTFTVPVDVDAAVSGEGFADVDYHSGEPFSGTDWANTRAGETLSWATESHAQNVNANAIRWGTLYNFRFTANAGPADGQVTLGMFMPGTPEAVAAAAFVPSEVDSGTCPGDVDGDGGVGFGDILQLLSAWGDCQGCSEDINGDGSVSFDDLLSILSAYGPCP